MTLGSPNVALRVHGCWKTDQDVAQRPVSSLGPRLLDCVEQNVAELSFMAVKVLLLRLAANETAEMRVNFRGLEVGGQDRTEVRLQLDPVGNAPQALTRRDSQSGQAAVEQLLHHHVDGDLGQAGSLGELRAGQPSLRKQQVCNGPAIKTPKLARLAHCVS